MVLTLLLKTKYITYKIRFWNKYSAIILFRATEIKSIDETRSLLVDWILIKKPCIRTIHLRSTNSIDLTKKYWLDKIESFYKYDSADV